MTRQIRCEICGGQLESQGGGRFVCLDCGLAYSPRRLRELAAAAEAGESLPEAAADEPTESVPEAEEPAESVPAAEGPETAADKGRPAEKEERLRFLQAEQMRLLAEIRMADGVFGPAQRRELSRKLRQVERELAKLQGRKLPFFF